MSQRVGSPSRYTMAVAAALLLASAWWATGLPPFSGAATLAVVGAGALMMVVGTARPPERATRAQRAVPAMTVSWVVLALALGAWQLQAYLRHPRADHPTLSSLTNAVLDTHTGRTVAFAAWLAAAYRLAAARR